MVGIKSGAQPLVAQLSVSMNIPVTTSLKGKGIISEQSPLSLGSLGVTSSGWAYQYIIDQADLVLFLGAGFNERTSYLWDEKLLDQKKIVQVDNDPGQLEKVFDGNRYYPNSGVSSLISSRQTKPFQPTSTRNHGSLTGPGI